MLVGPFLSNIGIGLVSKPLYDFALKVEIGECDRCP